MTKVKRREGAPTLAAQPQRRRLMSVCTSEVEGQEVDWLWRPYIPRGMVTLLEGDPGLGKSWISLALATALSRGEGLPGMPPMAPRSTLICNAEDSLEYSIVPRLDKLNANKDLIWFVPEVLELDKAGVAQLEECMRERDATILFIDPIVAYLGSKVDMHRANEVRPVMAGLAGLAERTNSAVIVVRHLRKGGDGNGKRLYAGLGSIDFTASVRSVLQVEGTKAGDRVIHHIKCNIGPQGPSISYKVTDNGFEWGGIYNDTDFGTVCKTPKARGRAEEWLKEVLVKGPMPSAELMELASMKGLAIPTLNRAKKDIAESYQTSEGWFWRLLEGPLPTP